VRRPPTGGYSLAWTTPARKARDALTDSALRDQLAKALNSLAENPFPAYAVAERDNPLRLRGEVLPGVFATYLVGPTEGYVLMLRLEWSGPAE
jgi:hypothetical protein